MQAENTIGFKDVPEDHWSYKAIMDLQEKILYRVMEMEYLVLVIVLRGQVARMLYAYLKPADEPNQTLTQM